MKLPWQFVLLTLLVLGCSVSSPEAELPIVTVFAAGASTFPQDEDPAPQWPQFLLPRGGGLLWPERSGLLRVEEGDAGLLLVEGPVLTETTLGLDRLLAGARGARGEIALLDSSGRVSVREENGRLSGFATPLGRRAASIAVADRSIYILSHGEDEGGPAVVRFSFDGIEEGRWGEMPADGLIQSVLRGGGVTACPDGSVFYSYLNSRRISRLAESGRVEPIGDPGSSFIELRRSDIRRAFHQAEQDGSTKPLVQLGLDGSRVMALLCSSDNHLFRQVTGPEAGSTRIEVWHPASGELIATIPREEGVLLAVEKGILYLGVVEEKRFQLRKLRYGFDDAVPGSR